MVFNGETNGFLVLNPVVYVHFSPLFDRFFALFEVVSGVFWGWFMWIGAVLGFVC